MELYRCTLNNTIIFYCINHKGTNIKIVHRRTSLCTNYSHNLISWEVQKYKFPTYSPHSIPARINSWKFNPSGRPAVSRTPQDNESHPLDVWPSMEKYIPQIIAEKERIRWLERDPTCPGAKRLNVAAEPLYLIEICCSENGI